MTDTDCAHEFSYWSGDVRICQACESALEHRNAALAATPATPEEIEMTRKSPWAHRDALYERLAKCEAALAATPAPADDERVLTSEITRLRKENSELASRLLAATPAVGGEDDLINRLREHAVNCSHESGWDKEIYITWEAAEALASQPASPLQVMEALTGLDERLDRLLLTATDNSRFVLSTESAKNIVEIVREWLRSAGQPASPLRGRDTLETLIREYVRDLRRNSSGSDDYPWEYAKGTADYLEILISRSTAVDPDR